MSLRHKGASAQHYTLKSIIIDPSTGNPNTNAKAATKEFLHVIEDHAGKLRQLAHVDPLRPIDPRRLVKHFGITIMDDDELSVLTDEDPTFFSTLDVKRWSGFLIQAHNQNVVILHPYQTPERARITLLEESAHLYFGHKPSSVLRLSNGLPQRTFNPQAEQEAYWTAAAVLLPALALARAVWRRETAKQVAMMFGCSVELVHFRLKILGFWKIYKTYAS